MLPWVVFASLLKNYRVRWRLPPPPEQFLKQDHPQDTAAVRQQIEDSTSRVTELRNLYQKRASDPEGVDRREKLLKYVTIPHSRARHQTPLSGLYDIQSQLKALADKSSGRKFADHVRDHGGVSGLLEKLGKIMEDYRVCSFLTHPSQC